MKPFWCNNYAVRFIRVRDASVGEIHNASLVKGRGTALAVEGFLARKNLHNRFLLTRGKKGGRTMQNRIRTAFLHICKRFWGCVPLAVLLLCGAVVCIVEKGTDWTLRTVPREILCVLGAIGIVIFLLFINLRLYAYTEKRGNKPFLLCLVRNIIHLASIAGVLVFGFYFFVFMVFAHTPEHVVEKNGIKMVASVNSFLDKNVDYYQYKNPLFYGKHLGHEWYGSGGSDPLEDDPPLEPISWMFYDLDGNMVDCGERGYANMYGSEIAERLSDPQFAEPADIVYFDTRVQRDAQLGMLTFSSPPAVYINSFNGYFYREKHMHYFPPAEKWQRYYADANVHDNGERVRWDFTENTTEANCPTVSVYTVGTAQNVWKTELVFHLHASTEMQRLQQDLYQHSMRAFFENATYKMCRDTYKILEQSVQENVCRFPFDIPGYGVKTLCYQGSVGVYAYVTDAFELHICFVPLTEELLREYESKGVTLYDISRDFK